METHRIISRIDQTWDGHAIPEAEVAVVTIDWGQDGVRIDVSSPFHDDPPPDVPAGPTEALWKFEIVEIFLVGSHGYLEVELGPHGHYLVLQLSGPRVVETRLIPIDFEVVRRDAVRWEGRALVPRVLLPEGLDRFNTYRIHGTGPARTYLAAFPVPGEKPDFHRLECFGKLNRV